MKKNNNFSIKKNKNIQDIQELDKKLSPFGFRVNDKGEIWKNREI